MYSFDKKKWKKHVVKQAIYPCICGALTVIIVSGALKQLTVSELLKQVTDGFAGIIILVFLFITWVTADNWLEERKRKDFPVFSITPEYVSLLNGLFEERVKTENVKSFKLVKKGKRVIFLSIMLSDGSSLTLEEFFSVEEIANELRAMGVNEL